MQGTARPAAAPVTVIGCVKSRPDGSPSCGGRDSAAILDELRAEIDRRSLNATVQEIQCLGRCTVGPNLRLKGGVFFTGVTRERIDAVCAAIRAHQEDRAPPPEADPGVVPPAAR